MVAKTKTIHKMIDKIEKDILKVDPNSQLIERIEKTEKLNKLTSDSLMELILKVKKISNRLGL